MESILAAALSAAITGGLAFLGVVYSSARANDRMQAQLEKQQAVTDTRLEELTREVRMHNDFARRVPVLEEKLRAAGRRLDALEQHEQE